MTGVFRRFFRDFDPPATVENLGVAPVASPEIDVADLDRWLRDLFAEGERRVASGEAELPPVP